MEHELEEHVQLQRVVGVYSSIGTSCEGDTKTINKPSQGTSQYEIDAVPKKVNCNRDLDQDLKARK